jgi:D-alanyl-D-alanine carboxypeptidase
MKKIVAMVSSLFTFLIAGAQDFKLPETGIAVVSSDSIFELKVWGHHKITETGPETAGLSDYFHLGSNTKAITGFVAATLVEKGIINWDTKFFSLFPEWKKKADTAFYEITLAELLSHRARIPAYTSGLEYRLLPKFEGTAAEKRKAFAEYILSHKPAAPSSSYSYSNAGYSIAALMLEKQSGKTWEQLVTETLNDKLKLNAGFSWPHLTENQPWGHWVANGKTEAVPPSFDYDLELAEPAGDIKMTLPDYARFIQLNLQGLKGKNSILKKQTFEYLFSGIKEYSIGWLNIEVNGRLLSDHMGSAGTFMCYTLIDRQNDRAYIVVTNIGGEKAKKEVIALRDQLIKKYNPK